MSDGWAEKATGHTAGLSADSVVHVHGSGRSRTQHPAVNRSPSDKGAGGPTLRGYVSRISSNAANTVRAITGQPHSPGRVLKHSTSDDLELAGYPLMNGGISPR